MEQQIPILLEAKRRKLFLRIDGWLLFFLISIVSITLWLLEVAYQYFVLIPGEVKLSLLRGSALAGMTLISAALASSAVFKWFPRYARYWRIRRYLGVSGFLVISVHVASVLWFYFGFNVATVFQSLNPIQNPLIFGVVSYMVLFAMALTSTDWAMKKIGPKRWKTIHRLVYVAFASAILHVVFTSPTLLINPAGYLMLAVAAFAAFGQIFWFFKTVSRKKFKSFGTFVGLAVIITFITLFYLSAQRSNTIKTFLKSLTKFELNK